MSKNKTVTITIPEELYDEEVKTLYCLTKIMEQHSWDADEAVGQIDRMLTWFVSYMKADIQNKFGTVER